jgi:hypothetical protein
MYNHLIPPSHWNIKEFYEFNPAASRHQFL